MVGRIPVLDVTPLLEGGAHPAKAAVGEPFEVSALVVREGHDAHAAEVVLVDPDGTRRAPVLMELEGSEPDRHRATVVPDAEGLWGFEIHGWADPLGTWHHHAEIKIPAGIDVELTFLEGALLLERAAEPLEGADQRVLLDAVAALHDHGRPVEVRLAAAFADDVQAVLAAHPLRELVTVAGPFPFYVDRRLALTSAWYEFFPRSEGAYVADDGRTVSGTFRTAAERLPAVAAMGFDIIYLPPIHPIGKINRKGRNNTLDPGPDDVGSPWAIGSAEGGHDAVHPDLGTIDDFDAFVARAVDLGLEVAIDLALQAAPDHPWATEHPEFFTTRADGSIAYAENPPKKYQDIYPLNFDNDPEGSHAEMLRIVRHWMGHGVRVFRVDNPHTKPVAFWEWLLGEVRKTDPDVIFLSEAFTRPSMLQALGMVGFHQSYCYFTWRNERKEIEEYLAEVSHETAHRMRPSFWVNTPDILPSFLQYSGPPGFKIRAALAATGSSSWGMYAGYELYEHVALRPGAEEYLDSEKFQIRIRDWAKAEAEGRSLAPYITMLNDVRRRHPALQELRNLTVHNPEDDHTICFSKTTTQPNGVEDTVIVVINLDPRNTRETTVHLDMSALGMRPDERFLVHDEVTGADWTWGEHNYVRLDPYYEPAHILSVRSTTA